MTDAPRPSPFRLALSATGISLACAYLGALSVAFLLPPRFVVQTAVVLSVVLVVAPWLVAGVARRTGWARADRVRVVQVLTVLANAVALPAGLFAIVVGFASPLAAFLTGLALFCGGLYLGFRRWAT